MSDAKRWYAIQSYSGHENKVKRLIDRKIEEEPGEGDEREIVECLVPTQEVMEVRKGKRVQVTKRLYPGMGHTINEDESEHVSAMVASLVE